MGIRDWLRKGALTVGLAGIVADGGCQTVVNGGYRWEDYKTDPVKIERIEENSFKYKIKEASFLREQMNIGLLKINVVGELKQGVYEKEITDHHIRQYVMAREEMNRLLGLLLFPIIVPYDIITGRKDEPFTKRPTGETKIRREETKPKTIDEVIKTNPAEAIPIEIYSTSRKLISSPEYLALNGQGSLLKTKTEKDGTLKVEVKISQDENNIFLDKEDIKKANWKNIKEPAESFIAKYLINHAESETNVYQIRIETNVVDAKNDEKNVDFTIDRWIITNSLLEEAVKQFVEEEFNSKIKKASITLLDFESHTPITLTKDDRESYNPAKIVLEPITKIPSKEDLMKPYFEGKYLQTASATLKDYITTKSEISIDVERGEASFYVYPPSDFKVKITHQKYHHISDEIIGFSKDSLDKEVYMSKIGKKVDLKIVDKEPKSKIKDKE